MPLENPFYTAETQGPFELRSIGRFELDEGGAIEDLQRLKDLLAVER